MSEALRAAATKIARWRKDPVAFVREELGVEPDKWQKRFLTAWASNDPKMQRIALQACAGPGKSAALAWAGWWTLLCKADKNKHPNGFAISMNGDNLRDGLWKELAVWRSRSPVLTAAFEWTQTRIFAKDHPATWWLSARTYSKTADLQAQGRTLSGLHAPYIFYLIDESGEIPTAVGRSAEQGLSNCEWGKIGQAGNPTSHDGMLHAASSEQADQWYVISITGDPDDAERSQRIDIEWARGQIKQHGRENPWVMAYILGKFPPSALNALLSPDEVRAAIARRLPETAYNNVQKRIGIDVARFGDDATVLFPRQGARAFAFVEMRGAKGPAIAARVAQGKAKFGSELELIDSTGGYGATVEDQCELAGIALMPVNFSERADDPRYFNKRSEMYFRAAEWVKGNGWLPNAPILVKEACAAEYYFDGGKLRVMEKDQMKKKLNGHSPDHWDALVTTFYIPDMPASIESMVPGLAVNGGRGQVQTDWDPHAERKGGGMVLA